jgi:hypothetical protein
MAATDVFIKKSERNFIDQNNNEDELRRCVLLCVANVAQHQKTYQFSSFSLTHVQERHQVVISLLILSLLVVANKSARFKGIES